MRHRNIAAFLPIFALLAAGQASLAQDEDFEEFPAGLLARYSAAKKTVRRVDPDVAFVWKDDAPDPRLPRGPFAAEWRGRLLVREPGEYRVHLYLQGEASVDVDGRRVLEASRAADGWVSGSPFRISFGEKQFRIAYRKTGATATLKVYWSSDRFPVEPVPPHLLFRDEPDEELALVKQGRAAFRAARCNRCHRRTNDLPSPPAPALTHFAVTKDCWLIEKLRFPGKRSAHATMPDFGFSREQAEAVAAFLRSQAEEVGLAALPPPANDPATKQPLDEPAERRAGRLLFRSLGCLACHTLNMQGVGRSLGGGDLTDVGEKRSRRWLYAWLADPRSLNSDHSMPIFELSDTERRQLAVYLSTSKSNPGDSDDSAKQPAHSGGQNAKTLPARPGDAAAVQHGRKLVKSARCAACHRIAGIEAEVSQLSSLSQPPADWSRSCLSDDVDRTSGRPSYRNLDRHAVIAYVNSRAGRLSPESRYDRGRRLLTERKCLACHQRDGSGGIAPIAGKMAALDKQLRGQSEALIPPPLTAVGDKLLDAALAEAVDGRQNERRLPWLRVRMPRFAHAEQDSQALLAYVIGHDRIPAGAPHAAPAAGVAVNGAAGNPRDIDESQTLIDGHALIGVKGFGCIACHAVGSYRPKNVALGTRGSDLFLLGERMREEFYIRWTRSPLRIVPGMEMPSYSKPVPGLLGEEVDLQLAVTWKALNNRRFRPPTNPSVVEQFLVVQPHEPPRIVRDVFTKPEENGGGYVARALAIGFGNGNSVLFDLDRFSLSQWTFGDFARQRTEGKSWYWDMAGVHLVSGIGRKPDLALEANSGENAGAPRPMIEPAVEHGCTGRLQGYQQQGDAVRYEYTLSFQIDGKPLALDVAETISPWQPHSNGGDSGWERDIEVAAVPAGYKLVLRREQADSTIGSPRIEPVEPRALAWQEGAGAEASGSGELILRLPADEEGRAMVRLRYSASLEATPLDAAQMPAPKATAGPITSAPGFDGVRLPLEASIMPTAMTFTPEGDLAFTSLKGHVYLARDADGDGVHEELSVFEEGLAAPYGILADGSSIVVCHKPEVLRLRDVDGDGRADERTVLATGWGYTDNYHDWTCGIVRDSQGRLYVGLGSDYAQPQRSPEKARWRGKVLQVGLDGSVKPVAHALRYPTGLTIDERNRIFVSDNQGVQNTFNEINHIVAGRHYGVPSRYEESRDAPPTAPALRVPHPWTRSVNGLCMLPSSFPADGLRGHGIGCEYNGRFLIRFTMQEVDGELQGAVFYFTRPEVENADETFLGPLCAAVSPEGELFVGSIHDSGWLGGQNVGEIARLQFRGELTNGLREIRATPVGFELEFFGPIDEAAAGEPAHYDITGYTRVWKGGYATPDTGRHAVRIESAQVSADARTVRLRIDGLREGYVYDVGCDASVAKNGDVLWPQAGHYTMNRIPTAGVAQ